MTLRAVAGWCVRPACGAASSAQRRQCDGAEARCRRAQHLAAGQRGGTETVAMVHGLPLSFFAFFLTSDILLFLAFAREFRHESRMLG